MCWLICLPWIAAAAPTAEDLAARIAEVERRPASDPTREALLQTLQQTQSFLDAEAASAAQAEKFAKSLDTGTATVKQLAADLAKLTATADAPLLSGAETRLSLTELQQVLETA
ncbi:MAG: hypothetical protein AB7I32_10850, partial [Gammaproteobacteria bacterium]